MITQISIEEVRAIGREMALLHAAYRHDANAEETAAGLKKLADLAEEKSAYHSQIFQKCNVIRSFACVLTDPAKQKKALEDMASTIGEIQNWDPSDKEINADD